MISKMRAAKDPILKLRSDAQSFFISPYDLEKRLEALGSHLGIDKIGLQVKVLDVEYEWGLCTGSPAIRHSLDGVGTDLALYVGDSAQATELSVQQQLHHLITALVDVWGREYRKHGALNMQASDAEEMLLESLLPMSILHGVVEFSVIYIDLDNFKNVNDQSSHSEGNKAIRLVYGEMHKLCKDLGGLALIDGGDEFLLVLPCDQAMDVSSRLWELKNRVAEFSFGAKDFRIGMTAGVVTRSLDEITRDLSSIKDICEELTKDGTVQKKKRRGTINFERRQPAIDDEYSYQAKLSNYLKLGLCLSKSRNKIENCFADERLNLIVKEVSLLSDNPPDPAKVNDAVSAVLTWFGANLTKECDELSLLTRSGPASEISQGAVTVAILHALSQAAVKYSWSDVSDDTLALNWSDSSGLCEVIFNGAPIWGGVEAEVDGSLNFGNLVSNGELNKFEGIAVGVQIGFDQIPRTPGGRKLPEDFLIDHVRVDVRPKTGGGLPDFWQAALAQVVSALDKANKPSKIIIWGEDVETTEIYKRLTDPESWTNDEIASLTGLTTNVVQDLATRLHENVLVVKNDEEFLESLYTSYQAFYGSTVTIASDARGEEPSLQRPMVKAVPLEQSEGIVCTTARVAYPLIVDTLRKTNDVRLATDDSGQEQRELIAFKLKLTNPSEDKVPDYLVRQKQNLNEYASSVLLLEGGVIRKELDKDSQVLAYCKYLAKYVRQVHAPRSTRRACLVVPHVPDDKGEPRPLGLISIWSTPRFLSNSVVLDFVFVWRTVEAFIGLPYSLYGSIQLAEQLTQKVAETAGLGVDTVKLGELNYVALSLHIGSDEFHTRVAKQIVDMASD
ncbi:diguanylate cyclase [Pseudomonas yamanorum]|uniref:diguanylate cyclase n=1 Tax=Pseudomonas yamanorum TaxID=515393 RepID=UPI00087DE318|nr:diguanylate cyclase [Pseudomonas yamanorum]SDU13825.1 diguanylate cyclase (GGDEF) domain-containing protein [Pseudomonas yamanorum]